MEFWPSDSRLEDATTTARRRRHYKSAHSSHPVLSHGGLGAARLRESADDASHLEWTTLSQVSEGPRLQLAQPSMKLFPATRSPAVSTTHLSTIARTEEAASLLRTYYPDAHVPFDLLRHQISSDEAYLKDNTFDPFSGNRLSTACICAEDARGRVPDAIDVLVFPSGELGEDLHVAPFLRDPTTQVVKFLPLAVAQESLHNPIHQIDSSSAADPWFAIRTRDALIMANFNALVDRSQPAPEIETRHFVRIDNADFGRHPLLDVAMSPFAADIALAVGASGDLYEVQASRSQAVYRFPSQLDDGDDAPALQRVTWGLDTHTALAASSKSVHWIDKRSTSQTAHFTAGANEIITSIESPQAATNLMCFCTTTQVLWFDPRNVRHPIVGWKHGRIRERTLEARSITPHSPTPLVCLCSQESRLLSLYDVDRPAVEGLVHAFGQPTPLLGKFTGRQGLAFGRSVHDTSASNEASGWSIFELGPRNEVVRHDVGFQSLRELADDGVVWDDALREMERDAQFMEPLAGPHAARKHINTDMTDLYRYLFIAPQQRRLSAEEMKLQGDAVHRVLHTMPFFWQMVDIPVENALTLFDLAFRTGDEPHHPSRADWLTGSALSTIPGHVAFAHHGIPGPFMARHGGVQWQRDLTPTLLVLDPQFPALLSTAEDVVPGGNGGESHAAAATKLMQDLQQQHSLSGAPAVALRRMREAVADVVLDSALASYVYSVHPFSFGERDERDTLPLGMGRLCLDSSAPPPPVRFGHLRPRNKRSSTSNADDTVAGDLDLPLGVCLLLSEWEAGSDPNKYVFRDPYGENGDEEDKASMTSAPRTQPQTQTQRTAPPVIIAASTLPARRREGSVPLPQSQPDFVSSSQSQGDAEIFTSTQVVPGPFGGRPQATKKKVPKKRVGGF